MLYHGISFPRSRQISWSLNGNAGFLDHVSPFLDVRFHPGPELLGRRATALDPEVKEPLAHLRVSHDLADGAVKRFDDRCRRFGRSKQAVPGRDLVPGD